MPTYREDIDRQMRERHEWAVSSASSQKPFHVPHPDYPKQPRCDTTFGANPDGLIRRDLSKWPVGYRPWCLPCVQEELGIEFEYPYTGI